MTKRWRFSRKGADAWLGTLARYAGLVLLIYAVAIDRFRNPALLPASVGLILYRNVSQGND